MKFQHFIHSIVFVSVSIPWKRAIILWWLIESRAQIWTKVSFKPLLIGNWWEGDLGGSLLISINSVLKKLLSRSFVQICSNLRFDKMINQSFNFDFNRLDLRNLNEKWPKIWICQHSFNISRTHEELDNSVWRSVEIRSWHPFPDTSLLKMQP